jgi:hypothetical protein
MADLDFVAITRWLSSSEFLWIALVVTAVIVTLKIASRLLEAGLAETIKSAFTTNWQLTILATSAFLLSIAAGSRTWDGMRQFTGEPVLSLLITFGIQGVMLIIAWLIGESFAAGLASGRAKAAHGVVGRVSGGVAGLVVGGLMFAAAGLLLALYMGLIDPSRPIWGFAAQDKFVQQVAFVAVGVMLIGPLFMARSGGIIGDYANGLRIVLGNAVLWLMFLACAGTSVFFSYISLFDSIFPAGERVRAAEIRAINQVSGIVADIGETATRRRIHEAEALFKSDAWASYERELDKVVRLASIAPEKIREEMVRALREQETRVARLEEQRANASGGQAGLAQRKTALGEELSRLTGERPEVAVAVQEQKAIVSGIEKRADEQRAKVMAEEKGVEGSGKAGRGQFWRAAREEEGKVQSEMQVARERLKGHETRLSGIDRRIGTVRAEVAQIDGDLAKLAGEAETAQRMIAVAKTAGSGDRQDMADPSATAAALERERQLFRQKPEQPSLARLQSLCATMQSVSMKVASLRNDAAAIDCDPKQATEAAAPVFALNVGLAAFAQNCAGGDHLPQSGGTDGMLAFGRKCLQDSGLVSREVAPLAARLSSLDLSRDDKAHKFVVSANAFTDGNRLAYLALAIAIGMDSLILMAALFGATAVRSPLTDLDGINDLTPEQLEAAIDATLMQTAEPARTLTALLQSQRPIAGTGGYTSEIRLDDDDPLAGDMRSVLTAGASIGAVRPFGDGRSQFQIKTGLSRYFAVAQKKRWPKKSEEANRRELMSVIGVALMPDTAAAAGEVIEELHPISDLDGFAAELNVRALAEPSRQPLIRGVLGAGATVAGAVQRDQRVEGRYFVSNDFYKTLLLMRAGAIGAYVGGPPALPESRHRPGGTLREHQSRPMLTHDGSRPNRTSSSSSLAHRLEHLAEPSLSPHDTRTSRSGPMREPPAFAPRPKDDEHVGAYVDQIVERLGIQAGAEAIARFRDEGGARPQRAGEALEKLMQTRTTLGVHAKDLERARRAQIDSEVSRLASGADATQRRAIDEAADRVYRALPILLLLPGGQFEAMLRHCLDELDAAAAPDSGHRDIDFRMQRQMRILAKDLEHQERDTDESWAAVENLLLSYDELGPAMTVVRNV